MKNSPNIILATDYSEAAMNAERFALQFAKATGSDLCLIHAYEIPLSSIPNNAHAFAKVRLEQHNYAQKTLEQHCSKLFHSLGIRENEVQTECIVKEGHAASEIRKEATKRDASFIIVGTHGSSGLKNIVYGTQAWEIIKKSGRPVIAIPAEGIFSGLKNIVFAMERRKGEIVALQSLIQLLKPFEPEITMLYIADYIPSKEFKAKEKIKFQTTIKNRLGYEKLYLKIVYHSDIMQGIADFCFEKKVDMLVMSPEKTGLLDKIMSPSISLTKRMSFQTRVPLLCIPDYYVIHASKIPEHFDLNELYIEE